MLSPFLQCHPQDAVQFPARMDAAQNCSYPHPGNIFLSYSAPLLPSSLSNGQGWGESISWLIFCCGREDAFPSTSVLLFTGAQTNDWALGSDLDDSSALAPQHTGHSLDQLSLLLKSRCHFIIKSLLISKLEVSPILPWMKSITELRRWNQYSSCCSWEEQCVFLTSNNAKRSWPPDKGSPQWPSEHQHFCSSLV